MPLIATTYPSGGPAHHNLEQEQKKQLAEESPRRSVEVPIRYSPRKLQVTSLPPPSTPRAYPETTAWSKKGREGGGRKRNYGLAPGA